jgi:lipoprotein NlpD
VHGDYGRETYVVQPHDTLYSIAWRHDLDYQALARWNGIGPDYHISVGQILTLRPATPSAAARPPAALAKPAPGAAAPGVATRSAPTARSPPATAGNPGAAASPGAGMPGAGTPGAGTPGAASQPSPEGSTSARWAWPTSYLRAPRAVTGGGVLLEGVLGQPVRAACNGRIVYVGNGIRGYGNLIIIKHDENFLSAYAHTREVAVHEGQQVLRGQLIAQMGAGPHQVPALYFEIRLNGKPVDPVPYLAGSK